MGSLAQDTSPLFLVPEGLKFLGKRKSQILLQLQGGHWCILAGRPSSCLVLLQPWLAPLPIGFFLERAILGDQLPAHQSMWAFSFFFYDFSNYYLRGLGFLALDTSPRFLSLPEKGQPFSVMVIQKEKSHFSPYWLRSSARVFILCLHLIWDSDADHCSHFKLSGFVMVEHWHAGSW